MKHLNKYYGYRNLLHRNVHAVPISGSEALELPKYYCLGPIMIHRTDRGNDFLGTLSGVELADGVNLDAKKLDVVPFGVESDDVDTEGRGVANSSVEVPWTS